MFQRNDLHNAYGELSLEAMERLAEQAAMPTNLSAANAYSLVSGAGAMVIPQENDTPPEIFVALLTASAQVGSVWTYSWTEQGLTATNTYTTLAGGRSGTTSVQPAYELNNNAVATPTLVWMRFRGVINGGSVYEFDVNAGGTPLTVQDVTGTPSFPDTTTLEFVSPTVTLSSPSAGVVLATIASGSAPPFVGCSVTAPHFASTATSGNGSPSSWNTTVYDTGGFVSAGVVRAPATGYYLVCANTPATYSGNVAWGVSVQINVNGSDVLFYQEFRPAMSLGDQLTVNFSTQLHLNAADIVTLAYGWSGGSGTYGFQSAMQISQIG